METGTVKWFCDKGFGFIAADRGEEIFARSSQIETEGPRTLWQGQRVSFEVTEGSQCREAARIHSV